MKDQSKTNGESWWHETDREQKMCPQAVKGCAAHPKVHMSRLERYGHVKPKRKCDLWLFDSNIHYSILSPLALHSLCCSVNHARKYSWVFDYDLATYQVIMLHEKYHRHSIFISGSFLHFSFEHCQSFSTFLDLNDRWFIELFLNACWKCQRLERERESYLFTVTSVSLKLVTLVLLFLNSRQLYECIHISNSRKILCL